jgi:hypothetical protein
MNAPKILACRRVSSGEAAVPSLVNLCSECGEPVWRANSSPKDSDIKVECLECFERLHGSEEPDEIRVTLPQADEMAEHLTGDHPNLCEVIERLCDSLRDVRRSKPETFFGRPVETLYNRLEAALSSFYRAKVPSTSPDPENAS